jgi:hypothetical protein
MNRNEAIAIAKVMGWGDTDWRVDELLWPGTSMCLVLAKDLQSRMVEDGWQVDISLSNQGRLRAVYANAFKHNEERLVAADTEPAAIVELFCKVHNITGDQ